MAGMRFDPTITMGNLITFVGGCVIAASAWGMIDKRLAIQEEARVSQAQIDRRQDEEISEMKRTNREDFKEINGKLDKILLAAQRPGK